MKVSRMRIRVSFYSYFKDLAGCAQASEEVSAGSTLEELLRLVLRRFPKLEPMKKSMLVAVGVDYESRSYVLKENDEVSLFPPVQGG